MIPAPKPAAPIIAAVTPALSVVRTGADEPKRLAGKLGFDDTPSSLPKVDVELDAALVKELKAAR